MNLKLEENEEGRLVVNLSSQDSDMDLSFNLPTDFSSEPKDRSESRALY